MEKKGIKFLVLIALLAIIGGGIYFLVTKKNSGKLTSEEKAAQTVSLKYFFTLGEGYDSKFNGTDFLYRGESFTKDDLNKGIILTAAFNYISDPTNKIDNTIEPSLYAAVEDNYNIEDAIIVKAENVRKAIKTLFDIEFEDGNYDYEKYKYIYKYDFNNDVYVRTERTNTAEDNYYVLKKVLSTKKDNQKIITKVAVIYAKKDNKKYIFYADSTEAVQVAEKDSIDIEKLSDEEIEKFKKYEITVTKKDGSYLYESTKVVKD